MRLLVHSPDPKTHGFVEKEQLLFRAFQGEQVILDNRGGPSRRW